MGNITGNSQIINHGPDDLFIGDNEFASEVKKSGVTVAGTALTAAQADALRASGILALDVTNIGKQDNQ